MFFGCVNISKYLHKSTFARREKFIKHSKRCQDIFIFTNNLVAICVTEFFFNFYVSIYELLD